MIHYAPRQGRFDSPDASPVPTYTAPMSGVRSGTISVNAVAAAIMTADWDKVYGPGYYDARVLGTKLYARATLTGNEGTTMHVELNNEHNIPDHTEGAAEDNHGNIFKVSVYN